MNIIDHIQREFSEPPTRSELSTLIMATNVQQATIFPQRRPIYESGDDRHSVAGLRISRGSNDLHIDLTIDELRNLVNGAMKLLDAHHASYTPIDALLGPPTQQENER